MNLELIEKLNYSYKGQHGTYQLPEYLQDSLHIISDFFINNKNNKLALVFPSKEYAAQWLSVPMVLLLIEAEYTQYKQVIYESFKQYNFGDRLILNNKAIVEWVGIKGVNDTNLIGPTFRTKSYGMHAAVYNTIKFTDVIKLQKAPANRKSLSSIKTVKEALPSNDKAPIDELLNIETFGNREFLKHNICLVSKLKTCDDSLESILLNRASIFNYISVAKINEYGIINEPGTLLISKNLAYLSMYLARQESISKIIIDGYSAINERGTDFSDIDNHKIPTILITDLSEIETFENIRNYAFEFYNFTKKNLKVNSIVSYSPFEILEKKIANYMSFKLHREICNNPEIEAISQILHSIEKDDSNSDLTTLMVSLVKLTNIVASVTHELSTYEISVLNSRINDIHSLFLRSKTWLGVANKTIEESILLFRTVINKLSLAPSAKCIKLKELITSKHYDYIICPTEDETKSLSDYLISSEIINRPQIISIADVSDELTLARYKTAIVTGWAKSHIITQLLSTFLFSELTVLFYKFENRYYNSLQRRNKKYCENIKTTINIGGIRTEVGSSLSEGYNDLYSVDNNVDVTADSLFDILDFELRLDTAQYSKYAAKGTLIESIEAKRVNFDNDWFIYSAESHKFLVINGLFAEQRLKTAFYKKSASLKIGDIIAFINTDKDILVDLVEKNTNTEELASVKRWTELWKKLLKDHLILLDNDFGRLISELRKNGCVKHETTIRAWLQDESRIGPEDDADLISIACLTNSSLLLDNLQTVRESIKKMVSWRIKASNFISDKIKSQLHELADNSIINSQIPLVGLGSVHILKVTEISISWESIDVKYVNRLLKKESV